MISGNIPARISILSSFEFAETHKERARWWLIGGGFLSFVGFMLPWFRYDEDARWSYGGSSLLFNEEITGLWIVVGLYALLGASSLFKGTPGSLILILAVSAILSTMVIVSVSTADALQEVRTIDQLDWSFGLFVMLPGHGILLWGAIYRAIIPVIDDALTYLDVEVNEKKPL